MPAYGTVVSFTNITTKDFTHAYGGRPYFVKAGETRMFPYDLADHLATHLARSIFIDADTSSRVYDPKDPTSGSGKPLWDEASLEAKKREILGDPINEETERPLTESEILAKRVDDLESRFGTAKAEEGTDATTSAKQYRDKAQVIKALETKGITFDPRKTKAELELLLNAPVDSDTTDDLPPAPPTA